MVRKISSITIVLMLILLASSAMFGQNVVVTDDDSYLADSSAMLQIDTYPAQVITIKAVQELILQNKEQQSKIDQLEELVNRLLKVVEPEP